MQKRALAARGQHRPVSEGAKVEFRLHGPTEAVQTLGLPAPAPIVVAHLFHVPYGKDIPSGLLPGHYTMDVRILTESGTPLATSIPYHFDLRAP